MHRHESAKELCAKNLEYHDDGPNNNESWVGTDTFKHINLIVNLSSANHVEDLHEDKHVKNYSEMS